MPEALSKLPPIYIEIHQPGDKGEFHINVFDGKTRAKISENRLPEERSYLEYIYTSRLLEGGTGLTNGSDPQAEQQVKHRHDDLVRYGQMLYRDLFGKGDSFKRYIAKQPHLQNGAQLVLRLHSTATELWNTPWEYMHDGTNFLGIQPQFPILRSLLDMTFERSYLDLNVIPCPLRILMVIAHPKDASPLNVDTEIAMIHRAVKGAEETGRVEIDFVEEGTLENLQKALEEDDYHILHYSGHGSVAPYGSFLVMEDEQGLSRPVFLRQILPLLEHSRSMRFVFLSACKAGTITATKASSGIATGLLQVVPAVLAMQFSVQDRSASVLAEAFYGSIGRGETLEEALHSARRALHHTNPMFGDWGVPALYLHKPNIRLLDVKATPYSRPRKQFDMNQLPKPDPFVGRLDERRNLRAVLPNANFRCVYIWGMAGIGKSALVRQVMQRTGKRDLVEDVLVLHCDKLQLSELMARIAEWIGLHFPDTVPILNDKALDPVKRLEQAGELVRGKRIILVLDGIDRFMKPEEDRHGEFPHPLLAAYFRALATQDWWLLTIFTSRLRWAQLPELPKEHSLEVHLDSLLFVDILFLLQNLPHLKSADAEAINGFFNKVGGHPLTTQYVNTYLGENPQQNPLSDPQLAMRLTAWWHKLFLADVFKLLRLEERDALKLLSVHGESFNPRHVQLLVKLPSQEEAERIMVGWEALSLASFIDVDEDDTPWYIVPNLVQTYVTSQLKPDMIQRSHAEVARMMQRNFFLSARDRFAHLGGPEPKADDEFHAVLDDIRVMTKRLSTPSAQRYLQMAYSWHSHFREADDPARANEIALAMLPSVWMLHHHELGRKLVELLLKHTDPKNPQHIAARFWEATYLMEAGQGDKAMARLQTIEKWARQHNLTALLPNVLERQAEIFRNQGNHPQAYRLWKAAMDAHKRSGDTFGMVQMLLYMGENAHFHGDAMEAVKAIESALELLSKLEAWQINLRVVATLLLYRGHIFRKMKNDAASLERYSDVLHIGEQLHDTYIIAKGLESIGYNYGLLRQYDIAAKYLLQAVDLYEKMNNMASLCVAQTRLAMIYDFKGNTSEALVFCERALQLAAQYAPSAMKQTEEMFGKLKRKKRWGV